MIEAYLILASRIRNELEEIRRVVERAQRAVEAARRNPQDADLFLDSAALSLHDAYSGFERLFKQIAAIVDRNVPSGTTWHRELLNQMGFEIKQVRPAVLSRPNIELLEEYLRFRHVVRNIYAFSFQAERIGSLVQALSDHFARIQEELLSFASFLEEVGRD
ncbi:MAG: hypothetical protein KatS3mg045_1370 [Bellilinea sp.]|nr:MAG: hypothetical protein KatS3mg045_1370 [Bellilinea sp.]